MGQLTDAAVRIGRKRTPGKALLESSELIFRGEERLTIPFKSIETLSVASGELRIVYDGRRVILELGALAAKWAEKIRNPKSLLDKLGVKPGMTVAVVGIDDKDFLRDLKARVGAPAATLKKNTALIFYGVTKLADLARLAKLKPNIHPAGAIWAISPKGRRELNEDHVRAAALKAGLVDVKVVAFSATHSALKLVIPLAKR